MAKYLDAGGVSHLWELMREYLEDNEYELPAASSSSLGGIIVGDGLEIDSEGVLSATGSGGGGSGYGSTMRLTNGMTSRELVAIQGTNAFNLSFSVSSIDDSTGIATGNITASWYSNGARVRVESITQGSHTVDVRRYLTRPTNTIQLLCEDSYGNTRSITWTITVTEYTLAWNLNDAVSNHADNVLAVNLVPTGVGEKIIKLSIDGVTTYTSSTITASGRTVTVTVPAQTHGAHTILAWIEVSLNGETISTTPIRHVGIWTDSESTTPIIAVYNTLSTISRYGTVNIDYMVYDPAGDPADITLSVGGNTVASASVDRTTQTWAYRADNEGTVTMTITCGATTASITLTVTALDYDIAPVENGLVLDVDPANHTNTELNYDSFGYSEYDYATGDLVRNHPFTFSNGFDWINGGFQLDDDGVTAFVVKRGDSIQFDRSFFDDNAKTNGKEIKLVFKVENCRDYDSTILSCYSGSIGLVLAANQGTLSSELQSRDIPYCEGSKIEMDVNIESTSQNKLATVWLEGIPSRVFDYSNSDGWIQADPENVTIGSTDADVWIYRIKMYGNSLTDSEILSNFIADCANVDEMLSRYERNDIFTNGEIDMDKLAQASPTLRIIHITAPRMTAGKKDYVTCDVEMTYTEGGADYEFTATGVKMATQGTSSMAYGLAAYNLDLDFSSATWEDGNGFTITDYAMSEDSIPVNYFNIKLNVASSENANNVLLADDYNTYQPFLSKMRLDNPKVRDTIEGHPCAIFFTNSSDAPIIVGARTLAAGETVLYGCGDMNNSKKNFEVFGQTSDYPGVCCVEIANNNNDPCLFKTPIPATETWDGDETTSNFEFRYPKSPTAEQKAAWSEVVAWVASTDSTAATGDSLDSPVTYAGTTYTTDTAAYRLAKFRAEVENYFWLDSLLYHYLFTERHTMIDNRAKNTFASYEPDARGVFKWNFNKDYDNDTGEGNDNIGGLSFTYGIEDTDQRGSGYAFNAYDSVLWCNVRDCFPAELAAMYRSRESLGAWSASRILDRFNAYQAARPEALVAEDMRIKYYTAHLANTGQINYLAMMLGTKKDQRQQYETYQEGYMASKYKGTFVTATDFILMRTNTTNVPNPVITPSGDIPDVVPYADAYLRVQYGNAGEYVIRARKGQTYTLVCPTQTLNDTETQIFYASNIASMGSLAAAYPKFVGANSAKRLMQLIAGDGTANYVNTSFTDEQTAFGAATFLEVIDMRGLPNFAADIDISHLSALREIYTTGSGVTGITFARRAPVTTAVLNPLRLLIARDLSELTTFTMGADNLQRLIVENCPAINTKQICASADNLTRVRLIGVNWQLDDLSLLTKLESLAGQDEAGNDVPAPVVRGTAHIGSITSERLGHFASTLPDLTITYDTISYAVTFVDYDGRVISTQNIVAGQDATAPANPTRTGYTFTGWSGNYHSIAQDTTITATYSINHYTVTFTDWDDTVLSVANNVTYGTAVTPPNDPSRTGYTFTGWDHDLSTISDDTTIQAVYTINTYTITFNIDGVLDIRTCSYGDTITAPTAEKTSDQPGVIYYFEGWQPQFNSTATESVTYTAIFTERHYLYKDGDAMTSSIAGGWTLRGSGNNTGTAISWGGMTVMQTYSYSTTGNCDILSKNAIDFSNYSKLCAIWQCEHGNGSGSLSTTADFSAVYGISTDSPPTAWLLRLASTKKASSKYYAYPIGTSNNCAQTEVDLSTLTQTGYIRFANGTQSTADRRYIRIKEIWLEV